MCKADRPAVVCLGFFDGVHKGHLALLHAARAVADERGWPVCVHTFDHAPGSKGRALTTLEERTDLLLQAGADQVAVSLIWHRAVVKMLQRLMKLLLLQRLLLKNR